MNLDKAVKALEQAQQTGMQLQVELIRRRALYPTADSMDEKTHEIMLKQAQMPLDEADPDKEHLLQHISLLRAELRKLKRLTTDVDKGTNP